MMKIKCWISGSGSSNEASGNSNGATAKNGEDVGESGGGGGGIPGPGVVAKIRPTSLNVNQLNYNVVDLKKFLR